MNTESEYKCLDNPKALQTVSFLFTKFINENGFERGCSILKTEVSFLKQDFDYQHWEYFFDWKHGQDKFNNLVTEYKDKGFKTWEDLGIEPKVNSRDQKGLRIQERPCSIYHETLATNSCECNFSDTMKYLESFED